MSYGRGFTETFFEDIDADGDFDALVATDNNQIDYYYFENIGTSTVPDFREYQDTTLDLANPFGLNRVVEWTGADRRDIAFTDIDNDGDLDAFVGGESRYLLFEQNGLKVDITNQDYHLQSRTRPSRLESTLNQLMMLQLIHTEKYSTYDRTAKPIYSATSVSQMSMVI